MKKQITQRKIADNTRNTILKSARKLFAVTGFSGTSTKAIAKAAKTNEALIFHHFGSKAQLWQKVKASVVESISLEPLDSEPASLHVFLESAIRQRLSAYQQKPELARLIQWQALETKQNKLFSGNALAPTNWITPLRYLQQAGKIKSDVTLEFIIIWLTASINTIIFDSMNILQEEIPRNKYILHLVTGFEKAFS